MENANHNLFEAHPGIEPGMPITDRMHRAILTSHICASFVIEQVGVDRIRGNAIEDMVRVLATSAAECEGVTSPRCVEGIRNTLRGSIRSHIDPGVNGKGFIGSIIDGDVRVDVDVQGDVAGIIEAGVFEGRMDYADVLDFYRKAHTLYEIGIPASETMDLVDLHVSEGNLPSTVGSMSEGSLKKALYHSCGMQVMLKNLVATVDSDGGVGLRLPVDSRTLTGGFSRILSPLKECDVLYFTVNGSHDPHRGRTMLSIPGMFTSFQNRSHEELWISVVEDDFKLDAMLSFGRLFLENNDARVFMDSNVPSHVRARILDAFDDVYVESVSGGSAGIDAACGIGMDPEDALREARSCLILQQMLHQLRCNEEGYKASMSYRLHETLIPSLQRAIEKRSMNSELSGMVV